MTEAVGLVWVEFRHKNEDVYEAKTEYSGRKHATSEQLL